MTGYLGIDPGLDGGMALVFEGSNAITYPMPVRDGEVDPALLIAALTDLRHHVKVAVLEKVQPMKFNGCIGSFKLGTSYGVIKACLVSVGMPIMQVSPSVWAKEFPVNVDRTLPRSRITTAIKKERARIVLEIFGGIDIPLSQRAKNMHDGRVDAVLIAEYGRRKIKNGELG